MAGFNTEISDWHSNMDRDWIEEEVMDTMDNEDVTQDQAWAIVLNRKVMEFRERVVVGTVYDSTEWTSEDGLPLLAISQDQFLWDGVVWDLEDILTYHWD
jgi:hypothetical protein